MVFKDDIKTEWPAGTLQIPPKTEEKNLNNLVWKINKDTRIIHNNVEWAGTYKLQMFIMTDEHTNKHIQSKARHSECKAATFSFHLISKSLRNAVHTETKSHIYTSIVKALRQWNFAVLNSVLTSCIPLHRTNKKQVKKRIFLPLRGRTVYHLLWHLKILLHSRCKHLAGSLQRK